MPHKDTEVKALERISNKYLLTTLVCKRVKQLQRGAKPFIEEDGSNPFDIALKEIAAGKIILIEAPAEPTSDISEKVEVQSDSVEQNAQPDAIEQAKSPSAKA